MDGHSVKVFEETDGKTRLYIFKRDDGLHWFGVEAERDYEFEGNIFTHWLPIYGSGLYENLEAAEKDALAIFPWIRERAPLKFSY